MLSKNSETILSTTKPPVQAVVRRCAATFPYQLIADQGLRTAEQEMALWLTSHDKDGEEIPGRKHLTGCNGYKIGMMAPNGCIGTGISNHQSGEAVDIVVERDGAIVWNGEDPVYRQLNDAMQKAGADLGFNVEWGGDFPPPSKPDYDHWRITEKTTA